MGGKYSTLDPMQVDVPKLNEMLERDPYLRPYEREFRRRYACFKDAIDKINESGGGIGEFTQAYKSFGVNVQPDNSVVCREWAPGARQLFLAGEFSKEFRPPSRFNLCDNSYCR
uniref:Uncharacterized protein n=1 Tax=Photinus pyralis TaxID=7054 RepID=A0A1Y1MH90_PHOPY